MGTVDLIADGFEEIVIVRVFSTPPHRIERARIARARSCRDPNARPALMLAPVVRGISRTVVPRRALRLLASRAILEVYRTGRRGLERVSCGELRG